MTAPFRTSFPVADPNAAQTPRQPIDFTRFQGVLNPNYQTPAATTPGTQTTEFGTNSNLISNQFAPGQSPQLQQAGQQTQQAGQNVGQFQTGQYQPVGTQQYGQYTGQAQNLLGQAGSELGNVRTGQYGTIGSQQDPRIQQLEQSQLQSFLGASGGSQESDRLRQLTAGAAEGLAGAPSRQDIALQTLQNLDAEQADVRQLGIQDIGRNAARLGRLGSGMVTTSLGDLESQLNSQRERSLRDLSAQTASQEMGDRLASLSGLSGAGGQFRAEDLAGGGLGLQQGSAFGGLAGDIYGREAGLRAEDRGERNFQYGTDVNSANLALQRLGAGQSLAGQQFGTGSALRAEDRGERDTQFSQNQSQLQNLLAQQGASQSLMEQLFGQGQAERGELRTERNYQQGEDQRFIDNAERERILQEQIAQQGFGNRLDLMDQLRQTGYGGAGLSDRLVNLLQQQATGTQQSPFDFLQSYGATPNTGTPTPYQNPDGTWVNPTNPNIDPLTGQPRNE